VGVFVQRVLADGSRPWGPNGVPICTLDSLQLMPALVSDGAGGAIITWFDGRGGTSDIYAQRVNASGVVQWTANGVPVSTAAQNQDGPTLVSDGAGGAIIVLTDTRNGPAVDLYAQRINSAGVRQWSARDVALSTALNDQVQPRIVSDGSGGAIVTWFDYRAGARPTCTGARIPRATCSAIGSTAEARRPSFPDRAT
jgi:hypothetical protein